MKTLTFLTLLLFSFSLLAKVIVVSDLDDTIKIINSGHEIEGARNALLTNKVFTGIPAFYTEMSRYTDELHILSAGPSLLKNKITKDLASHGITYDAISLRKFSAWEDKLPYKVNYLIDLFKKNPEAQFILLGDDIGKDPEAYDEIMRHYPGRVLASYIHMIENRNIPKSQTKYWHTAELFLREYTAQRMPYSAAVAGFDDLLKEEDLSNIIPDFAHCPKTPIAWSWQYLTTFRAEANELVKKLNKFCQSKLIVPLE